MALTKNIKSKADYHTWLPSEFSAGDILGIQESLGRPADQLTIESIGGQSVIRLNVSEKVFGRQTSANPWMMYGAADFYTAPLEVTEVENVKDDIIIESGSTWFWENESAIVDIKIITKAPNLKITVS